MELTYVAVQGRNRGPPPRAPKNLTVPLNQLWNLGVDQKTRHQVLRILSRVAATPTTEVATCLAKPHTITEASDE